MSVPEKIYCSISINQFLRVIADSRKFAEKPNLPLEDFVIVEGVQGEHGTWKFYLSADFTRPRFWNFKEYLNRTLLGKNSTDGEV